MKKFQIPIIPSTTNKTIRFPNDVIEKVEAAINGKQCNFSAFVIEAVRVALCNLEEDEGCDLYFHEKDKKDSRDPTA